jgi:hypothetical protein
MVPALHRQLAVWANSKPKIAALYIFGSSARPGYPPETGLDLAIEFMAVDDELVELLLHREVWQWELAGLSGFVVRGLFLWSDRDRVKPPIVTVYRRPLRAN